MLFSSLTFLILFLPSVLLIYYIPLKRSRRLQNYFLFIASLFFYAFGEPWFVFVMIGSIIFNFLFGLLVAHHKRRWVIVLMLLTNLGILFIFKYLMFTVKNINLLFNTSLSTGTILLPIGISFFTFQAISYVMDIYRDKAEAQTNLLNVGLYISFFPQLIAGPIIRYETIALQIQGRKESFQLFSEGVSRFLLGFFKKILIANNMAVVADHCFKIVAEGQGTTALAWLGAIAYGFQIFFDFSGYSDMAIGLGRMFGFKFPENFNYPYISKSASEFWRRWHISLGTWFRDYLYIPLGGSRTSKSRTAINLFIVWLLTGFWHGANWTFVCWGLMWCLFITIEKTFNFEKKEYFKGLSDTPFSKGLMSFSKHIYLLLITLFGWVLFRALTINEALDYIKLMLGSGPLSDARTLAWIKEYFFIFLLAGIFSVPLKEKIHQISFKDKLRLTLFKEKNFEIPWPIYTIVMVLIFLVAISYLVKGAHNPFIYFNF